MRSQKKFACLGMILIAGCLAQPPPSVERGAVSGIVTNAAGEPLRRVTLQLRPLINGVRLATNAPVYDPSNFTTESDPQGNFTFDEVVPGRYMLFAERPGYLNADFSSSRDGILTINPSQRMTDVVIKMIPQSIIAGRVVDDENEPLPGATVNVSFYAVQKGQPPLQGGSGTTNADGVFAIGGLIPGRYVASVAAPPSPAVPQTSTSQRRQREST